MSSIVRLSYWLQSLQAHSDEVAMNAVIAANWCIRVLSLLSGQTAEPRAQIDL
jgi:hypothetical protein